MVPGLHARSRLRYPPSKWREPKWLRSLRAYDFARPALFLVDMRKATVAKPGPHGPDVYVCGDTREGHMGLQGGILFRWCQTSGGTKKSTKKDSINQKGFPEQLQKRMANKLANLKTTKNASKKQTTKQTIRTSENQETQEVEQTRPGVPKGTVADIKGSKVQYLFNF